MKWSKLWNSHWTYRILALLLALALFAYVNGENLNNTRQTGNDDHTITATVKRTLKVQLQLDADTNRYFVTGYPEKVSVELEGSSSLVTMTANTMNFRVVADLNHLGVGTHTVQLKPQGLNKDLTYHIKPKTIRVKIQDRRTRQMPIQVKYNKDSLAQGYEAGRAKLSADTASVTGGKGEIDRIYQVVANVVLTRNTKTAVDQEVILQALDDKGNTVNVVVSPQTVRVQLPVRLPKKRVPLTFRQTGKAREDTSYAFTGTEKNVEVYGPQAVLDQLDSLVVDVDVSGITKDTDKMVDLTKANNKLTAVTPKAMKVAIKVSAGDENSAFTPDHGSTESSSSSASSSSSSSKKSSSSSSDDSSSSSSADNK